MSITLTEQQNELVHLMYTNINNANAYCEALIEDDGLFKGIKVDVLRPIAVKLRFLKQAMELRMRRNSDKAAAFEDTLVYDEVSRLMIHMSHDNRLAVENFAKSLL